MEISVSVIVPVFNRETEIVRCIESIRNQTLKNIEIIVVDDGSTDNTPAVLRAIDDKRLVIISQENTGQGIARNRGIAASSGKYTAFVDSDDTIEPEMLEVMYNKAEEEHSDAVQCGITDIYPDGGRANQHSYDDETVDIKDKTVYTAKYFSPSHHSYEVCNKLIRKEILRTVQFGDTKKYFSEDLLFNMRLIEHINRICFISKPYYNYYKHDDSHFHSNAEKRLTSIFDLFKDYYESADSEMSHAMSHTAAMVIIYNLGFCVEKQCETAARIMISGELKKYIKNTLKRGNCSIKHRIFLLAMLLLPLKCRLLLAKLYSGRWRI